MGDEGWFVRGRGRLGCADGLDEGEVAVEVNLGGPGLEEGGVAAGAELIAQGRVVEDAAEGGVELRWVVEAEGGAGLGGDFG